MFGIALLRRNLSDELIARHQLQARLTRRSKEADEEIQFIDRHCVPLLPVWMHGQLRILPWGNRTANSRLPRTSWCPAEGLKEGEWNWLQPLAVEIPASYGCDRGVWYAVSEGVHGIVVREAQRDVVYPLSQRATHYYEVMTRSHRMPVLIGETI